MGMNNYSSDIEKEKVAGASKFLINITEVIMKVSQWNFKGVF